MPDKKRVFISFDFDNDRFLKDAIIGQSKHPESPFEVIDHSLKEEQPQEKWEEKARKAIGRSEIVVVMLGENTFRASGVLKEIKMAKAQVKLIIQVTGYADKNCPSIPWAGLRYDWTWDNLKKVLS